MTWKESNHFVFWYSYHQSDFLPVTFLQVNFAELTVSQLFYNPQLHSIILTCQKLEINTKNTILQAKRNPNIVIIFYSRRQLGTTEPGNTNGGGRGEKYCTNNASDFNKQPKCFLQKLDNWLTFAYWVFHFFLRGNYHMTYVVIWSDDDDDELDKWWWWW